MGKRRIPRHSFWLSRVSNSSDSSLHLDAVDALARAELAEAEVVRLQAVIAHKDEIIAEARAALYAARTALESHLNIKEELRR
ncbi:MAG: hypothetical protein HKN03_04560 [Acidimicrobiales bacterium]|nr:hypothetical protein [Acidimicrobiales bacterium]